MDKLKNGELQLESHKKRKEEVGSWIDNNDPKDMPAVTHEEGLLN